MASIQAHRVKRGTTYYRIVESKRINGKPRPIPIAYLGTADNLLARLQNNKDLQIYSQSHGAIAALYAIAQEIDLAGTIDRYLAKTGRWIPDREPKKNLNPQKSNTITHKLSMHDGLSVGQSLTIAAIGRACYATSKRAFADWAKETTIGEFFNIDVKKLTSQHFWDQMDQLPPEIIPAIEKELIERSIELYGIVLDLLLIDSTNFFTFIASTNTQPQLPKRGHQKQKRNDLKQISVMVVCSRFNAIPLFHHTYEGNLSDTKCFNTLIPLIKKRLVDMKANIENLTIVFDKGNVSKKNQKLVDDAQFHYVTALTVASQRSLVDEANKKFSIEKINENDSVLVYRTKKEIWGKERTVVVLVSERLKDGQMRGILQHVEKAKEWLSRLSTTLAGGKQKRTKERIKLDIETRLRGRQHLNDVMSVDLKGEGNNLSLTWNFNQEALDCLADKTLGRIVLVTDRHEWSTTEIIRSYRSQSNVEGIFSDLKDTEHLAIRPQYHWTDQKLHVHVQSCLFGYLLAQLALVKAQRAGCEYYSIQKLLDDLKCIRKVYIAHPATGSVKIRVTTQFEKMAPKLTTLLKPLKISV